MSFVNLKGPDLWSGSNITNQVHTPIRNQYSEQDELKATRLSCKNVVITEVISLMEYRKAVGDT